jgi:hypothetical protein
VDFPTVSFAAMLGALPLALATSTGLLAWTPADMSHETIRVGGPAPLPQLSFLARIP